MVVLRRLDCVLEPTKDAVLRPNTPEAHRAGHARKRDGAAYSARAADPKRKHPLYNTSPYTFRRLLGDPENIAPNLVAYINGFSATARAHLRAVQVQRPDREARRQQPALHHRQGDGRRRPAPRPHRQPADGLPVRASGDALQRAGERGGRRPLHAARGHPADGEPRLHGREGRLHARASTARSTIPPAARAECCRNPKKFILAPEPPRQPRPLRAGIQRRSPGRSAARTCSSRTRTPSNIVLGDTLGDGKTGDGFAGRAVPLHARQPTLRRRVEGPEDGRREGAQGARLLWPLRRRAARDQRRLAAVPAAHDLEDAPLPRKGRGRSGSKIAIVFNGSPLFSGDAGSGPSNIRRWIIENDWLDAIVALPDQLFYNTGIFTYVWLVTNRKAAERRGKVQFIDGTRFFAEDEEEPEQQAQRDRRRADWPAHAASTATSGTARRRMVRDRRRDRDARGLAASSRTASSASSR